MNKKLDKKTDDDGYITPEWKEYNKKNKEYLKYVRKEILELIESCKKNGTHIHKKDLPKKINSYEWNLCLYFISDEHLIETSKYYIEQSSNEFRKTEKNNLEISYNDILKHKIIHLLMERLEQRIHKNE